MSTLVNSSVTSTEDISVSEMRSFDTLSEINGASSAATVAKINWPSHDQLLPNSLACDHFIQRNGFEFAGTHLILDFWGANNLDNLAHVEAVMREAVVVAKATLLHIHLHHFTPNGGISGVAVLAESHISVHTWPERGFAAFDIFMCGDAEPEKAIEVLSRGFTPESMNISEHLRGTVATNSLNSNVANSSNILEQSE